MQDFDRVDRVFALTVDATPAERARVLAAECDDAPAVRREVESLLAAHDSSPHFLAGSPVDALGAGGATPALTPGTRVGAWVAGERLGRGASADVFRASRADAAYRQTAALKLLHPEAAADPARFAAERRILASLEHPGIARLLDGGVSDDGRPYAVIEFVDGQPITEWCASRRAGLRERLELFAQVCDVVAYAHRNLVVHRDLKPGNIFVGADGRVKLLDFGIAKLLDDGRADETRAPLTPDYAAPEQLTGRAVTTATDTYALGVLLFELLTGERPWRADAMPLAGALKVLLDRPAPRASEVAARNEAAPVAAGALAGDLDAIVAKCLRKDPAERYPTVESLHQDLERYARHVPVGARRRDWTYVFGRFLQRNRWATAGAVALFVVLAGGLASTLAQAERVREERDSARRAASREEAVRTYLTTLFRNAAADSTDQVLTAKAMIDRSAERVVQQYRDDPARAGQVVIALADLYGALGDLDGQEPLLQRFIAAASAPVERGAAAPKSTVDPGDVALARSKLATIELLRGHPDDAGKLLDEAERIFALTPGRYAEQRLEVLLVRGQYQRAKGDLPGSVATLRSAIDDRIALSGRLDRETANLYNSLAITLTAAGRLDEALAANREALSILRQTGRGEDMDALVMLANTGTLAFRTGRRSEAERILGEAYRKQRTLGGDSPAAAAAMGLYGAALGQRGDYVEAVPTLQEAAAIAAKLAGPETPVSVQMRLLLGEAQAGSGDLRAARTTLKDVLNVATTRFGPTHLLTLRIRVALAKVDALEGHAAIAQGEYERLAAAFRSLGANARPQLAQALVGAGDALLAQQRPGDAAAPLAEAIAIREQILWSGAWELAEARARLGDAYADTGRPARAAELRRPALESLTAELGAEHPQTTRVRLALAQRADNSR